MSERNLRDFTDEELIKEFQDHDTIKAFELLVGRFKNPLFNYVYRFLNDEAITKDVVQETMIKVYKNKDSYKSIARFSTWIYTIAGNLARTELQRKKRKRQFSIDSYGEEEERFDLPDEGHLPDELADAGIKDKLIQDALMKISDTYREVVILRDIEQLAYEEIAEVTGLSVGTVKSRINRGRAQLQELLKDIYNE